MALSKVNNENIEILGKKAKFIKDNWRMMNDKQIAEKLDVYPYIVKKIRLDLNLKRRKRLYNKSLIFNRLKINKEELAKALNEDGFTVDEFIKYKKWEITRQGLYLILNEMGIKILVNPVRSDTWRRNRYLRIYPRLTDENWLRGKKIKDILKEFKIGRITFYKIKKVLNIKILKPKRQFVDLICSYNNCRIQFKKPLNQYKQVAEKGQKKFYCGRNCYFKDRGNN